MSRIQGTSRQEWLCLFPLRLVAENSHPRLSPQGFIGQGRSPVPRLTIIIPAVGSPTDFEDTLASVLQNRPGDCEIIVPLTCRYDDPYELRSEVSFPTYDGGPNIVELFNLVLADVESEVVHLLQCGMEATEGWCDAPIECFEDRDVAIVSPAWQVSTKPQRCVLGELWTRAGRVRRVRRRKPPLRRIPPITSSTLAAGFYRTEDLRIVGGLCESVAAPVSPVATSLKLADLGTHAVAAPESVVRGDWSSPTARGFATGRSLERLRRMHRPDRRAAWPSRLLARAVGVSAEQGVGAKLAHLVGSIRGGMERGIEEEYAEWLADVKSQRAERAASSDLVGDEGREYSAAWRRAA